jgi:mercuric ion binding protein
MNAFSQPRAQWRSFVAALLMIAIGTTVAWAQSAKTVYTLQVDGLACPFCAYGVEKQLRAVDGVATVETDIKAGTVTIDMRAGATLDEATAKRAVERAGFTFRGFKPKAAAE